MEYNFEKLEVYKLARELVVEIYETTEKFPKSELFGLSSQIRRAAVSIALNIAEGATGRSKKDFVRFIVTAIGSLVETKAAIDIAVNLKFATNEELKKLESKIDTLFFKLTALKKSLGENE